MTDSELLQQYIDGSEAAFAELVRRHIDLVYSAAVRQVRDPHLAEDVVQRVFLVLSQKAPSLREQPVLGAWLYTATRYACLDSLKQRARRQRHERKAAEMAEKFDQTGSRRRSPNDLWDQMEPVLDGAMASISGGDRRLLIMRFWENQTIDQIATILGISGDAAKKRTSRAVDRLRKVLLRRGVVVPAAMLAAVLASETVKAAPVTLVTKTVASIGPAGTAAGAMKGAVAIMGWTKAKIGAVTAVAALALGGGSYMTWHIAAARPMVVSLDNNNSGITGPGTIPQITSNVPWRAHFDAVYHLGPGEVIKRVAPPYIPERMTYLQTEQKDLYKMFGVPKPDELWLTFGFNGTLNFESASYGKPSMGDALESGVGMRPYQIEADFDPWAITLPGDLISRHDASVDQKFAAFEPTMSAVLGRSVHFEKHRVLRNVIVVQGTYDPPRLSPGKSPTPVDITVNPIKGRVQNSGGTTVEFFWSMLERVFRMKVVDQRSAKKPAYVMYRNNNVTPADAKDPQKLQVILDNLAKQMSLQFTVQPQEIDVWQPTGNASATSQTSH